MFAELDRLLDPPALAARAWRMDAETPLRDWPRLAELDPARAESGGTVQVSVAFREDQGGAVSLEGELAVTLRCICQRCLEEMEFELRARPKLFFGAADELGDAASADGFELCELEPGMTLRQLLEDEALLSLPVFPAHERSEDCGALAAKLAELEPAAGGEKSSSPFAVLAGLKRKN
jgi:uncharacterized protein